MVEYEEALLKQRVWHWLETEQGMQVDGEIALGTGRIDLLAKSPDGEVWGIEIKTKNYQLEQCDRYAESKALDYLYLASGYTPGEGHLVEAADSTDFADCVTVDNSVHSQTSKRLGAGIQAGWYTLEEVITHLKSNIEEKYLNRPQASGRSRTVLEYITPSPEHIEYTHDPIELATAARRIRRSCDFTELGIIKIPDATPEEAITPGSAPSPEIIRPAQQLSRDRDIALARSEEPWVRHRVWQEYGGIPEGHIPSILDSDNPYRPIDIVAFEGSNDPTDAVETPTENRIIGIEAKGIGSYSKGRLTDQLTQFLETSSLSELYLAIPTTLEETATEFIASRSEFDQIGILVVADDGTVTTAVEATTMVPDHDGYFDQQQRHKTGYGENPVEGAKDVQSPYITDEEADRLKYAEAEPYASDLLTDNSSQANPDGYITSSLNQSLRKPLDDLVKGASAERVYALKGRVVDRLKQKRGNIELGIAYYKDEDILRLNFTRYIGGYIWFTGKELDLLQTILQSIESISGGTATGQGYMVPDNYEEQLKDPDTGIPEIPDNAHPGDAADFEERITLKIVSQVTNLAASADEDEVAGFQLDTNGAGTEVSITKAQYLDLIASIAILRDGSGKSRELPKQKPDTWGHARIAPSGNLVENTENIDYRDDVIR